MATPTLKFEVSQKALDTQATISGINIGSYEFFGLIIGWEGVEVPVVKWGIREMPKMAVKSAGGTASIGLFSFRNVPNADTQDIVVTWDSAITVKAAIGFTLPISYKKDKAASNAEAGTGSPSVSQPDEMSESDEIGIVGMLSQGPEEDTEPTFDTGWTKLGRKGTTGGADTNNLTLLVGYQQFSEANPFSAGASGGTARDWITGVVTLDDIEPQATDYWGSEILIGDTVRNIDTLVTYTVTDIFRTRNVIKVDTGENISAINVEIYN